jgi:hypothetical protein
MTVETMMVYDLLLADGAARAHTAGRAQTVDAADPQRPLEIAVVFTDLAATANALRTAAELAFNLHGRIRLIVPQVVPFPLPLESPPVLVKFQEQRFRRLACELPVETRVEIYLCRDADELLLERLDPHSAVVIGEGKPWWRAAWWPASWLGSWWASREKALARRLRRKGHEVVLARLN